MTVRIRISVLHDESAPRDIFTIDADFNLITNSIGIDEAVVVASVVHDVTGKWLENHPVEELTPEEVRRALLKIEE
jgi:hypothetical protein